MRPKLNICGLLVALLSRGKFVPAQFQATRPELKLGSLFRKRGRFRAFQLPVQLHRCGELWCYTPASEHPSGKRRKAKRKISLG